MYEQALSLFRKSGNLNGEAKALANLGNAYATEGRVLQETLAKALSIEVDEVNGDLLSQLGKAFVPLFDLHFNKYNNSIEFYQKALSIFRQIEDRSGEASALLNIGSIYAFLSQYDKAIDYYQQALPVSQSIQGLDTQGRIYSNLAYIFQRQKQPELSIIFYKQSVNIYESIRQDLRKLPKEQQKTYAESVAGIYRRLAGILFQQNRVLEAQQVLDLLKTQELENYLRNTRGIKQSLIVLPPEQKILARYNALQQGVIGVGKELADLEKLEPTTLTPTQTARKRELRKLQKELNELFNTFASSKDVQAYLKQLTPAEIEARIPFDELQAAGKKMAELTSVLFYPAVFEDRLELIITLPNAQPLRRTVKGVGKKELNAAIAEFRQVLQDPTRDPKPIAQKLYNWLIKPIEPDLQQAKKQANAETIIYAPDGQLRYIPLAALHDGQNYLIQSYRINNITAKAIDRLTLRPQSQPRILAGAFGNTRKSVTVAGRSFNFAGLDFAIPEVQQLSKLLPNTQTMLAQQFTPEATILQMNDFSIVHLATHAALVPENADQSFILFGDGNFATLKAIESWTLNKVDLIVLSACETGLGGKFGENGEEVLGLGYQFTKKDKANAAIATLWQVDDGGTETLMNQFYTTLKTGKSKAEALQQAQIAMITQKTKATDQRGIRVIQGRSNQKRASDHPYYWAPFILIGNGL